MTGFTVRLRWLRLVLLMGVLGVSVPDILVAQAPVILRRARVDPNRLVDFHATVTPETLFVNQQATYQVAVLLDQAADGRLPRNPEYLPPELRGLLAYDLGGQQRFAHQANGKNYTAYVFQKALFPLAAGTITIPPPQLTYALRTTSSYFSREESHTLKAESSTIVVLPLPTENRPDDFAGAVGVLTAAVQLDSTTARVGDPLVLTLRVSGSGNIKLLPRPTLEIEWATSVQGTERLRMDTSNAVVRGSKEFEWILTPTRAGAVETPVVRYPYFNPNTRGYEVAEAPPVTFAVDAGSLASSEPGETGSAVLTLRDRLVGSVAEPLLDRWQVLALLALLPIPALVLLVLGRPKPEPEVAAIETLRAMVVDAPVSRQTNRPTSPTRQGPNTARDVRRLLLTSLARRLDVGTDVLTDRRRTRRVLRRRGVTAETTETLIEQLNALDLASFAPDSVESAATTATLSAQALALYDGVDKEALEPVTQRIRHPKKFAQGTSVLLVSLLAIGTSVVTVSAQAGGDAWLRAGTSYANRQFVDAATGFRDLALISPRDADVLTNWGVAAWAAGDTVSAVVAWQRAARLDPLAADLREHLMLLPSGSRDGIAEIPMVPVFALTTVAIVLWLMGWSLVTWLLWQKRRAQKVRPVMNVVAVFVVLLATASGATALWGSRHLRLDRLAVVARPETMREMPESSANALGGAATGDVVRIDEVVPRWARVEHADGRAGWIPADRLAPLASAPR